MLRAGWGQMLLLAPWVLLVLWGIYVTMFASVVETDASAAVVQNYLRRTRLPWQRVTDVRLRYQIVFAYQEDGREREVKAFGGPATGRPARPRPRAGADEPRQPSALRDLDLIREQWEAAVRDGPRGGSSADPGQTSVTRSWDLPSAVAFIGLVVWALVAVLITSGPS